MTSTTPTFDRALERTRRADVLRIFAMLLLVVGVAVIVLTIPVVKAHNDTEDTFRRFYAPGAPDYWGPGPGIVTGALIAGFGILLLAIRRPTSKGKPCSFCAEIIRRDASVCRFCGRAVEPTPRPVSQDGRQANNTIPAADRPQPIPKATATAPPPWEKKP